MTAEQKSALAGVVTIDKEVMHETPCFAHTRVPVQTLIDFLETGELSRTIRYRLFLTFPQLLRAASTIKSGEVVNVYGPRAD